MTVTKDGSAEGHSHPIRALREHINSEDLGYLSSSMLSEEWGEHSSNEPDSLHPEEVQDGAAREATVSLPHRCSWFPLSVGCIRRKGPMRLFTEHSHWNRILFSIVYVVNLKHFLN